MFSAAKGFGDLKKEVLDQGLCTGCGMCVGMCPYIKSVRDRAVVIHPCGIKEGGCYLVCPRTGVDAGELDREIFGREREDHALGVYRGIYFARAAGPAVARAGQYGGVVTALTSFALDRGLIEGAALAGGSCQNPGPVLARTADEVLSCAGSRYTAVPTLTALNGAAAGGVGSVGVVGRPCQVEAVRKGQALARRDPGVKRPASGASLVIGLFCFWSLGPDFYRYLEEKAGDGEILKVDIPTEGLALTTSGGTSLRPVSEIRPLIREACQSCIDCTSEWADLSVGSTECDPAWNTLLVRSDSGESLVNSAVERGIVEIKPYPEERLPLLRKAALNKKVRVLHDPERPRPGYLEASGEYAGAVKKQWEVLQQ